MKRNRRLVITYVLVVLGLVYLLIPFYWAIIASIQPVKYLASGFRLVPIDPTLQNYNKIFQNPLFALGLTNSLIVASSTTVIVILVSMPASYAFARLRFRAKNSLLLLLWFGQVIPALGILLPYYLFLRNVHLYDTQVGLVLTYTAFLVPFGAWLMKSFFETIPTELEEAAMIDGCTRRGGFLRVVLPLAAPGLAASGIFVFITTWNDFLFALIFTAQRAVTIPLVVAMFVGALHYSVDMLVTGAVVAAVPPAVLALVFQRWIISGLLEGAGKF